MPITSLRYKFSFTLIFGALILITSTSFVSHYTLTKGLKSQMVEYGELLSLTIAETTEAVDSYDQMRFSLESITHKTLSVYGITLATKNPFVIWSSSFHPDGDVDRFTQEMLVTVKTSFEHGIFGRFFLDDGDLVILKPVGEVFTPEKTDLTGQQISGKYPDDMIPDSVYSLEPESFGGVLYLRFDWEGTKKSAQVELTRHIIIATIGTLLMLVLSLIFLHRFVLKPVKAISNMAIQYHSGVLDIRLTELTEDEIGDLGNTLNIMLDKVKEKEQSVSEANMLLRKNMYKLKQTEKTLQENETFLNAIIENIPDMIFVKNAKSLRFIRLNKAGEKLLGYSRDDLLGKNDYDFFPSKQADFFIQKDRKVIEDGFFLNIPEEPIQTRFLGTRILHTKKIPIKDKEGTPRYLLGISADITDRKEAENHIKASLKEKEELLKEIHHRVKNNMQVVSSLLSLQSETINDQKILDVLMEAEVRVQSMAFVHEILYQTDNLSRIKLQEYLDIMTNHLLYIYTSSTIQADIEINARDINLDVDHAVPCGLIVTELVTNSLKYASTTDTKLHIRITADYKADTHLTMRITDNGPGLPADFDLNDIKTLGLRIVTGLITEQLEGTYRVENSSGVRWVIHWPVAQLDQEAKWPRKNHDRRR